MVGAVLVASLSILTELGFAGLQRIAVSPGLRGRTSALRESAADAGQNAPPPVPNGRRLALAS